MIGCSGDASPQQPEPTLPPTSNIPPGIYRGQITRTFRGWNNGVEGQPVIETEAYFEIVDTNGLPLIQPDGETPVEGLVMTFEFGSGTSTLTVESVAVSGNLLIISYTESLLFRDSGTDAEVTMRGFGSWTYEYRAPDRLLYSGSEELNSEIVNGMWASARVSESAELTK